MAAVASNGSPANVSKTLADQDINIISVTLTKDSDGFGFSVTGGSDEPYLPDEFAPFITRIKECGLAERDGRLTIGDRILTINDTPTDGKSHDDIIAIFKDESTVTMVVEKGAEQRILESYNQYSITPSPLASFANLSIFKGQQEEGVEDTSIASTIANSIKQSLVTSDIVLPGSPVETTDSKQRTGVPIIYPIAAVIVIGVVAITIVRAVRSRQ